MATASIREPNPPWIPSGHLMDRATCNNDVSIADVTSAQVTAFW